MPAENYYEDSDSPATAPTDQMGDTTTRTATLPKSFFPSDVKPGDVCSVAVERVHTDEVEVSYAQTESEEPEPETDMPPEAPPQGAMSDMME